ncbi:MAG: hypothetical protein JWL83_551 [Actinomycetia bacterium]|nr:hypothetical protein [Actinomycetes bacterium]
MEPRAKWIARPDAEASPRCAVPGCAAFATATLRIHPHAQVAWLVDLDVDTPGDHLCARHADSLHEAPGWVLHDERHRARTVERSVATAHDHRLSIESVDALPGLDLRRAGTDDEPAAETEDLLDARSPLLSRAFAKSRDS